MNATPGFGAADLQAISSILGDSGSGLRSADVAHLLAQAGIDDPLPMAGTAKRLFAALWAVRLRPGGTQAVVDFVHAAYAALERRHGAESVAIQRVRNRLALLRRAGGPPLDMLFDTPPLPPRMCTAPGER